MINISITLQGSNEELSPVLEYIAGLQSKATSQVETEPYGVKETHEPPITWTEELVAIVWRDLSYDCRAILEEIAEHDEGISTESLKEKYGITHQELGGRMSSLGHRLKEHGCNSLPYPIDWTKGARLKMINIWRDTILKIESH